LKTAERLQLTSRSKADKNSRDSKNYQLRDKLSLAGMKENKDFNKEQNNQASHSERILKKLQEKFAKQGLNIGTDLTMSTDKNREIEERIKFRQNQRK
jgi:hypothetical protein